MEFPFDPDVEGIKLRWRRDITESNKLSLIKQYLEKIDGYETKSLLTKRPEEVDQAWLYEHVWQSVNSHYAHLGINAQSIDQLTEQLGLLRYGARPRVGDAFSGGGSIPFEAARVGCDVNASDLNPIACMLTWGAMNIVGENQDKRKQIAEEQRVILNKLDQKITNLKIEHDEYGNRAKAYLYFSNLHSRNSINGAGGNIISLVNVSDEAGQSMGNAFWNGQAMFYGNGDAAFTPLAAGLDVAGHEMSHGVVQSTANLAYQGESGAMNEAFADIFGSMIDRDDWKVGEDIANPSVFP